MTATGILLRHSLLIALVAVVLGCVDATVDEPDASNLVRGTVQYAGDVDDTFARPTLVVAVFWEFPPTAPPYSSVTLSDFDFDSGPVSFELYDIPAGTYHIVATLQDGDDLFSPNNAVGSYPNHCQLSEATGAVRVSEDAPTTGIDLELFDDGGTQDPCQQATVPCPQSGRAALLIDASLGGRPLPSASDQLIYGLFVAWPPAGPPVSSRVRSAATLTFPTSVVDTAIIPGGYAVYLCLDYGADNTTSVCTAADAWARYPATGLHTFAADDVVHISMDLDAGTSQLIEVTTPNAFGCP